MELHSTILNISHKYFKIILSFFLKLFGEKRLVKSVNVLPLGIKLLNPIQKYPHIIESCACTQKYLLLCFYFQ